MKRNNLLLKFFIIIVAVLLVIFVCMYILDNTGTINQGVYRVNDAIIKSSLVVEEKNNVNESKNITSLTDITLDAYQENVLSMLLVSDVRPSRVYIDEIEVKEARVGDVTIYNNSDEELFSNNVTVEGVNITPKEQEGQYLLEIKINNMNVINNAKIPEGVDKIIYDGRLLQTLGVDFTDLKFKIKFNINILDSNGKLNVCKKELTLPNDDLITNGVSILRDDTSNYIFSVK